VAAYLIFIRDEPPHAPAEMEEYSRKTRAIPPDPNLTPLAIYGAVEGIEGATPDGVVLLRFPTMADARSWYESPGYQEAAVHRRRGADYRAILVEGL